MRRDGEKMISRDGGKMISGSGRMKDLIEGPVFA